MEALRGAPDASATAAEKFQSAANTERCTPSKTSPACLKTWRFRLLSPSLVNMHAHPTSSSGHPGMSIVAKISLCCISMPPGSLVGHLRPIDVRA
eukprot:8743497-Pyramimonas_sp.AAC.1